MTVGLPTYNRAAYLREAIDSVLAQTFTDFTLVISDNASTDGTPDVVASYDDPRIVYRRQTENRGWIANFNAALDGATTDYGIFLCDDDLLRPRALEHAVQVLDAHPDVALYHSAFDYIDQDGDVWVEAWDYVGRTHEDILERGDDFIRKSIVEGCRVCSSTAVFRLSRLPRPAYEPSAGFPADYLLYLRVGLGADVYFSAEPSAAYRVHSGSISAASWAEMKAGKYQPKPSAILQLRRVKLQFLRESAGRLPERWRLRLDVERSSARSLVSEVVGSRLPKPVKRAIRSVLPARSADAPPPEEPSVR